MNRPAPMQIAESATLNAGKWPDAGPVEVEEVDHVAVQQAVDHAQRAADQRQRPRDRPLQQVDDEDGGADADGGEEVTLPAAAILRKLKAAPLL
jgi:hypothetical protein